MRALALRSFAFAFLACSPFAVVACDGAGTEDPKDDDDDDEREGAAPGSACGCDDDCAGTDDNPGFCAYGVCMQQASASCASAGSTGECGEGARCWPLFEGDQGTCWPDCASFDCAGECDADGSCAPSDATAAGCDSTCSAVCRALSCPDHASPDDDGVGCVCDPGYALTPAGDACIDESELCDETSCDDGFACGDDGRCLLDVASPPPGPVPSCDALPSMECEGDEEYCGALVSFDPRNGDGYEDYPINGETSGNQYRSFIRRDLALMIQYAAAATACLGADFPGNGGDIMLGDMSEEDGSIPGTSIGEPGHPEGSHLDGYDMDIGYYQVDTSDNRLREVCDHVVGGEDQYHCVSEPYLMDIWRTAMFIGKMQDHPQFRAAGVDGKAGWLLIEAADALCGAGFLDGNVCDDGLDVVFDETEAEDIGWFYFHHHHFHVTILDQNGQGLPNW